MKPPIVEYTRSSGDRELATRSSGDLSLIVRSPRPMDQGYIASTWERSISSFDESVNKPKLRKLIDLALDHIGTRCFVACEPTNTDAIAGWLCFMPMPTLRLVHYAYVRSKPYRRRGVMRLLCEHAGLLGSRPLFYTMVGPNTADIIKAHPGSYLPIEEALR